MIRVLLDTDVLLAALRSPTGGSAEVLRLARAGRIRLVASVALVLEYESVATRPEQLRVIGATRQQVLSALDFIAAIADETQGHFRWRPQALDPADDMVLEAAINGRASVLLSFNQRDFGAAPERFGIWLCTPGDFLRSLRA